MHVPLLLRAAIRKGFQMNIIRRFSNEKIEAPGATLMEKRMIKPMYPTPYFGKTHKLSFLDQISDGRLIPMAFFFPKPDISSSNPKNHISQLLENSLAKVLMSYYPFAGNLADDTHIHCNDQGVELQQVEFDCPMSQLLNCPHTDFDHLVFPKGLPWGIIDKNRLISIQLSHFVCGGTVVSVCMSHTLGDASSLINFVKDWASLCRDEHVKPCPQFIGSSLFPPIDNCSAIKEIKAPEPEGQCVSKRLIFGASKIHALKDKISSSNIDNSFPPTSIEAISSVILKSAAANSNRPSLLFLTTDLRRHTKAIPQNYIGNAVVPLHILLAEKGPEMKLQRLVVELKKEKERISSAYKSVTQEKLLPTTIESVGKAVSTCNQIEHVDLYVLSCLSKLPVEDIDFGWGSPKRLMTPSPPVKNMIILIDNLRSGDGIEVSVQLEKQKMHAFENAEEILEFSSPY